MPCQRCVCNRELTEKALNEVNYIVADFNFCNDLISENKRSTVILIAKLPLNVCMVLQSHLLRPSQFVLRCLGTCFYGIVN